MTIWKKETRDRLKTLVEEGVMRHAIAGHEFCPETGREHWQCYGQWYVAVRMLQIKKQLRDHGIYLRRQFGDYDNGEWDGSDNLSYCCKDGDFEMWGTPAYYHQGQRNELHAAKEAILENPWCDEQTHMVDHFDAHVRGGRVLSKLRTLTQQKKAKEKDNEQALVHVYWGPAGTGKSRKALETLKTTYGDSVYSLQPPTNDGSRQWWDGYQGQKGVILEDFEPKNLGFRSFLILTDPYYAKRFEVKGGYVWGKPQIIIITCDRHPKDWVWEGQQSTDKDQLKRRFDRVVHFEATEESKDKAVWRDTTLTRMESGDYSYDADFWEKSSSSSSSARSCVREFGKADVQIRSTDTDVIVVDD